MWLHCYTSNSSVPMNRKRTVLTLGHSLSPAFGSGCDLLGGTQLLQSRQGRGLHVPCCHQLAGPARGETQLSSAQNASIWDSTPTVLKIYLKLYIGLAAIPITKGSATWRSKFAACWTSLTGPKHLEETHLKSKRPTMRRLCSFAERSSGCFTARSCAVVQTDFSGTWGWLGNMCSNNKTPICGFNNSNT